MRGILKLANLPKLFERIRTHLAETENTVADEAAPWIDAVNSLDTVVRDRVKNT